MSRYLDLSFGARLTADRAHHVTAVGPQLVVVDVQGALVPRAHQDVVIVVLAHILQVHDVIPEGEGGRKLALGRMCTQLHAPFWKGDRTYVPSALCCSLSGCMLFVR